MASLRVEWQKVSRYKVMDIYSHTTETDDVLYEEMKKFEHRNKRKAVSEN